MVRKKSKNGNTVSGMPSNGTFVCRHDKKNLQTQIDGRIQQIVLDKQ